MALIGCPECGREISKTATACPACGRHIRGPLDFLNIGPVTQVFLMIAFLMLCSVALCSP